MAAKIICDGCGKEESMPNNGREYIKPHDWFQRGDKDGIQDACSRKCIDKIAEKTGKTNVIIPI